MGSTIRHPCGYFANPAGYYDATFRYMADLTNFSFVGGNSVSRICINPVSGTEFPAGVAMNSDFTLKNSIWGLTGIFLLALIALLVIDLSNRSRIPLAEYSQVPDYKFIERSGKVFGKQDMLGKINIVNFFFTTCPGPCSLMNARVAELYRKYSTSEKVQFISITVDPQRDSLSVLQKYAERFKVNDQRWLFLRGSQEEIKHLCEQGFMLAAEGLPALHSTKLVLVDTRGIIRGYFDSFDEASLPLLTVQVRELLKGL
jgi:protein SCO1/2